MMSPTPRTMPMPCNPKDSSLAVDIEPIGDLIYLVKQSFVQSDTKKGKIEALQTESVRPSLYQQQTNKTIMEAATSKTFGSVAPSSLLQRSRRQLTPKVTLTKTTIVKSTPYLISRHHLDDTEMKKALRHQQSEQTQRIPRTYSYKGQRVTCGNSKYNSHLQSPPQKETGMDYYAVQQPKVPLQRPQPYYEPPRRVTPPDPGSQPEAPYFKTASRSRAGSHPNPSLTPREYKLLTDRITQNSEYGLKEMESARKQMEKQSKKLRKLFKKKVEEDLAQNQQRQVERLEEEVRVLKIKALQMEKGKLDRELRAKSEKVVEEQQKAVAMGRQKMKYVLSTLVLSKPPYKGKSTLGEDTDSSFSSFQFQ